MMVRIIALCTAVALLAAPSLEQSSEDPTFSSPCPSVFTYDPPRSEPGSWSGAATLSTDILLHSLSLNIELDNPALGVFGKLENWTGYANTQDYIKFIIYENDFKIDTEQPVIMHLLVRYNPADIPPRLRTLRFNEKDICNAKPIQSFDNNSSAAVNLDQRVSNTSVEMDMCGVIAGGNVRFPLIYHGQFFKGGDLPWLVVIYKLNKGVLERVCGGTLISHLHILTAAHCMQLRSWYAIPMENITVKMGVHSLNDNNANLTITRKLVARYIHEDYDPYTLQNDILILTLDRSVEFNDYIRPACLWSGKTELSRVVGDIGVVAGWGSRSLEDMRGKLDEPQMVRAPIVSNIECRGSKAVFHQVTYDTTLCAGYRNGSGPCSGDSGGGLYLLEDGKWTLRGVVSLALQNRRLTCDLNEYVVFTDTAQFLPWIKNILADNYINPGHRYAPSNTVTDECGVLSEILPLVYRGRSYNRGEMPWLVAIFMTEKHSLRFICAGTLVSDRHVITAAHCKQRKHTMYEDKRIVVKLGVHALDDWTDDVTVSSTILNSTIHESYETTTLRNDIMVLTLSKRVKFNTFIRPACLWSGDTNLSHVVGATGILAGWGDREANLKQLEEPRLVRLPIVSTETCRASHNAFHSLTSNGTLCAGDRDGSAPCSGDAGSGLYLLKDGKWSLRGIVSTSLSTESFKCNVNEYAVFTDTAQYLPWIERILAQDYFD